MGAGALLAWRATGPQGTLLDFATPGRLFIVLFLATTGVGTLIISASGEATGAGAAVAAMGLLAFGAGATLGADTSIDKVLMATAEQTLYDAIRKCAPGVIELEDGAAGDIARIEYLYSRAATIYGGTSEVQRNIIARRLLDLGEDR